MAASRLVFQTHLLHALKQHTKRVKEGPGGVDAGLEIFGKPSVAADPGKEPLDHPSARQNSKADLIRALGDDFDDDAGRGGDAFAGISAISKDPLDEKETSGGRLAGAARPRRDLECWPGASRS